MAVDTYIAYVGVYPSVEDAESDYQLVKDLHTQAGMLDATRAAGAHGVGARAELALDLAALRLDADAPECRGDQIQAIRIAFVEAVAQVLDGEGERERKRSPVRRDGPPAGVTYQHGEA